MKILFNVLQHILLQIDQDSGYMVVFKAKQSDFDLLSQPSSQSPFLKYTISFGLSIKPISLHVYIVDTLSSLIFLLIIT